MAFAETKVYFDGSHYIAIPHTSRLTKKRFAPPEEMITIVEQTENGILEDNSNVPSVFNDNQSNNKTKITEICEEKLEQKSVEEKPNLVRRLTRKELFNELYQKYIDLRKNERKKLIIEEMLFYFKTKQNCIDFVNINFERKQRNLICRRIRMTRKANLANFNYFCTFTYDDKKHTEESFKKKLQGCFKMMCHRRKWKYMGVWERAPKTNRLHFHGLFSIPKNSIPGTLNIVKDYDTTSHKMQTSIQSSYFNERFGRSDFKQIDEQERRLGNALAYLMKYIEKTGEKIVYSKNLPQYFISDILDTDIVCTIGQEDKKLLLFDDFMCLDEGELMGKVSPETIEKMRKSN